VSTPAATCAAVGSPQFESTVRDTVLQLLRRLELKTIFSNPGSTEIPFLVDLPRDFRFVLGLHEGPVVSIASGYALMRDRPALVLLHTTAGFGNAVSAIATARENRAPLVILVGQQDRRHLAQVPFLAGKLAGLAGDYPVAVHEPVRAQDLPGTIVQGFHEAMTARGPVIVVVPMDDWFAAAPEPHEVFGPGEVRRAPAVDLSAARDVAERLSAASTPALVVGAGADAAATWGGLIAVAEILQAPVWQEAFSSRAGFPQDHPLFAGQLPADRGALRAALRENDVVLTVGAGTFRQYPYAEGPMVDPSTAILLISDDPAEIHRSLAATAVLATPAAFLEALAPLLVQRARRPGRLGSAPPPPPAAPPLFAGHVLAALADHIAPQTVLLEEAPSNKAELHRRLPIRRPSGFFTPAMGGLGFALPAAIGIRLACPERPVVAVLGDGSAIYAIQGLWTAATYEVGVLFVVLANGSYAVMDRLASRAGGSGSGSGPWPPLHGVSVSALARGLGCEAITVETESELRSAVAEVVAGLGSRRSPLLLEAVVAPDPIAAEPRARHDR
jgi:benzoylformate decarboxylase